MVTARRAGQHLAPALWAPRGSVMRRDVDLAGDHVGQQDPVVGLVLLGAEHRRREPALRVACVQVVDEPRTDHAVTDTTTHARHETSSRDDVVEHVGRSRSSGARRRRTP